MTLSSLRHLLASLFFSHVRPAIRRLLVVLASVLIRELERLRVAVSDQDVSRRRPGP